MERAAEWLCHAVAGAAIGALLSILAGALPLMVQL